LIYGKNLACLGTAYTVCQTSAFLGQHRACKEKVAAGSALLAISLPHQQLLPDIFLPEMHQVKSPEFTGGMTQKTRLLKNPSAHRSALSNRVCQYGKMIDHAFVYNAFGIHNKNTPVSKFK
jgi:hypothetical protein